MNDSLTLSEEQKEELQSIHKEMKKLCALNKKVDNIRKCVESRIGELAEEILPEGYDYYRVISILRIDSELSRAEILTDYTDVLDRGLGPDYIPNLKEFRKDFLTAVKILKEHEEGVR